jgi:hypothetical protein
MVPASMEILRTVPASMEFLHTVSANMEILSSGRTKTRRFLWSLRFLLAEKYWTWNF